MLWIPDARKSPNVRVTANEPYFPTFVTAGRGGLIRHGWQQDIEERICRPRTSVFAGNPRDEPQLAGQAGQRECAPHAAGAADDFERPSSGDRALVRSDQDMEPGGIDEREMPEIEDEASRAELFDRRKGLDELVPRGEVELARYSDN